MDFLYKICKKCEIEKELDQFYADKIKRDKSQKKEKV
jgi:hypothetical protein